MHREREDDTEPSSVLEESETVDPTPPQLEPAEVLIVDDEPANLHALEAALEGMSTRIVGVTSGEDALREVLRRNIALILLDVKLPTTDGFEVATAIRSRARSRHIPIIFLTAYSQDEADIRRGYHLGAVDYLFKPVVPEVLRAKVQAFVDLRNRTAQVQAQAIQLRELERIAAERRLQEAKRAWEADALRRQMEEQRRINAKLAEDDRRKDEFLAILAHELRNPLSPIVTGLELVRSAAGGTPLVERACTSMSRQVSHLVRLVDDLLDVSRISRGKVELQKAPTDLRSCITQALETCTPAAKEASHTVTMTLPETPLVADVDPVRVTQLVNNLLSNAVRYTDRGGKIEIEAAREGHEVVLRVRDTGRGISEQMLGRIFDMFVQERNEGKGLGLGLTLVDQVVSMHGGTVEARSKGPGQGSEFEVRLPCTDLPPVEADPDDFGAEPDVPLRILVVDDETDIASTTQALLESWGHQVHVAHCGEDGIELAQSLGPDVVLLDIGLPDMDGYAVASAIRQHSAAGTPYLVAVTGFGQRRDRERAREAGFDAHIVKPATPDRLRRKLRECAAVSP